MPALKSFFPSFKANARCSVTCAFTCMLADTLATFEDREFLRYTGAQVAVQIAELGAVGEYLVNQRLVVP